MNEKEVADADIGSAADPDGGLAAWQARGSAGAGLPIAAGGWSSMRLARRPQLN